MERLAPPGRRCTVCFRPFEEGAEECANALCTYRPHDRWFEWSRPVAMLSGTLHDKIKLYKYPPYRKGWGTIFGRIIAGHLDSNTELYGDFDWIIPTPAYLGGGAERDFDHVLLMLERAERESSLHWPIRLTNALVARTAAVTSMVTARTYRRRRQVAESELRPALRVLVPDEVRAKRILVVDDIFTDGLSLNEVARALRLQGRAQAVCGLTLARTPWHG